jgi:uncharacterized protein (TIGR02001 family)
MRSAISFLLAAAALAATAPAAAADPAVTVSGGATLTSQYRFRGISLSDEQAALQGTINLNHASGAYVGVWASSLDGFGELGGSNLELDLYAGYKWELGGPVLDAGLLYYAYPGSTGGDYEFFEPYANLSGPIGPATYKVGVAYAWGQAALGDNSNVYVFSDAALPLAGAPVTLKAHLGYSDGDTPLSPTGSYLDWSLGADVAWRNLTFGVAYVDTDITAAENAALVDPARNVTDAAVVFSLTASF